MQTKVNFVDNDGQPIKSGIGKNNKPWSKFRVVAEDGETYYPFGPVKVGDTLEITQDPKWGAQAQVIRLDKHEELMTALRELFKLNQKIYNAITGTQGAVESSHSTPPASTASNEENTHPARDWENVGKPKSDVVHDVPLEILDGSEPVNLDDIPF